MSNQNPTQQSQPVMAMTMNVQSNAESLLHKSTEPHSITRKALWVLGLGLGSFILWASFAPLDEGVPASGSVTIDTKRRPVQHLIGGIVKEVLVREGERVKEGQVLVRLDEGIAKANYEEIRQRYLGLSSMQSRLRAEQAGAATIQFSAEVLKAAATDPNMAQQLSNQKQLFEIRRQSLQADIQALQESIEGTKTQRDSSRLVLEQRKQQLSLLSSELASIRSLVQDGYAPLNRQRELERSIADTQASIADTSGQISSRDRLIAEVSQRIAARRAEFRKEVEGSLVDVMKQVQADAPRFSAEQSNLKRIDILAPASGQVVGLSVPTSGAVIGAGHKLMDIVPEQQSLIFEASISPHLIDKVKPDLVADIRFNNFTQAPQLVVEGKVLSVSGDLITNPNNPEASYYLARIEVTPQGLKKLGNRQLQPGMPAEFVIKTGERTMLKYLLDPLLKRLATSMKEA